MRRSSTKKRFPGWEALYCLGRGFSRGEFLASLDLGERDDSELVRGDWRPRRAIPAKRGMGFRPPGPVIWTTWHAPMLLTDRIVELMREEGLTGWDTYPVRLEGKDGAPMPRYRGLIITGRCGPVDESRSKKARRKFPGGIFQVRKGLYFEASTWDGADFFMPPPGTDHRFTTRRVVEAFRRANVKNVEFTPLPDVESYPLVCDGPGRS